VVLLTDVCVCVVCVRVCVCVCDSQLAGRKHAKISLESGRFINNSPSENLFRFAESQFRRMYPQNVKIVKIEQIYNPVSFSLCWCLRGHVKVGV
jgi:hypothetical protein